MKLPYSRKNSFFLSTGTLVPTLIFCFLFCFSLFVSSIHSLASETCAPVDFSLPRTTTVTESGCFFSKATGAEVKYSVTFPAGYKGEKESKIPYAFFLHGRGGSENQFQQFGGEQAVDRYAKSGKTPFLVIALDEPKHSYWKNGPKNEFGTLNMITEDAISHFDQQLPGGPRDRKSRAIFGISMGGHGAMFATQKRPNLFSQLYSISPVFRSEESLEPQDRAAFGSGKEFQRNDPYSLAKERNQKDRSSLSVERFHIEIGKDDGFLRDGSNTAEYLQHLQTEFGDDQVEMHYPGGHDGSYWKHALLRSIQFLGDGFAQLEETSDNRQVREKIQDCLGVLDWNNFEEKEIFQFFSQYLEFIKQ